MLDDEYLREAERRARVFQGAWTGTSGTLAADVIRLIHYVQELRRANGDNQDGDCRQCAVCDRRDSQQ
jgi:hypothetical protein